jgi:MinD-like ATPase involved in chromosome partitioning or flagellar assembly
VSSTDLFQQGWDEDGTPAAPPIQARPQRAATQQAPQPTLRSGPSGPRLSLTWPPPSPQDDATIAAHAETGPPGTRGSLSPLIEEKEGPPVDTPSPAGADGHDRATRAISGGELTHDTLTRHRADIPRHGWRLALYRASGGMLNPGIGEAERARQQLRARVRRPLHAPYRVAVISTKGGVGKTTLAACIGFTMADIRGDQVSVIDANPDAGTLADRLTGNTSVTIRHLLDDLAGVDTLTKVTSYMSLAGRLKVLASDQDPAVSEALTAAEYEQVSVLLSKYFNLVLTDCGTGISHATMEPTLQRADTMVVVGSPTIDGASRAGHTLDWLESHGHEARARDAIIVLNCKDSSSDVDADRIAQHFRTRVRAVVSLPKDPHLSAGGRIELDRLRSRTKDALAEIAAHIADQFPDRHAG